MSPVLLIIISLLAVAFFAGVETAFIRANKLHIELKRQQGSRRGEILAEFAKHEHQFIVTMLVGNAMLLVLIGKQMDDNFKAFIEQYVELSPTAMILSTTVVTTAIVLFFAEFLPKALFSLNPTGILTILAYPIYWIYKILSPIVWFFYWLSKKILGLFTNIDQSTDEVSFGAEDLKHFIQDPKTSTEGVDTSLIRNTLELADSSVGECMIPRTSIIAFDINDSIADLEQVFIHSEHSKVIIYDDTIDNTLGYIHHSLMLGKPTDIRPLIVPTLIVPEVMSTVELMNRFIHEKKSLAIVVDEFGGTAGIITLEDILEEIFGEINDEYDSEDMAHKQISEREFELSGSLEIDFLNEKYHLNLPEDHSTLSGYVTQTIEYIPKEGDVFRVKNYEVTVLESTDTRIEKMRLLRILKDEG
jgi:putative hemolysin